MNELIINDYFISIFLLAFAGTVLLVFTNNYIRYLVTKKQIKLLFQKIEQQNGIVEQQKILVEHLQKTVTWFSKPENIVNQCPIGTECNTAKSLCSMAKKTLERISNENP